jgi:hypothetical protein
MSNHSSVIYDMFKIPQGDTKQHGTDETPVTLVGDSVEGWELFLGLLYPE